MSYLGRVTNKPSDIRVFDVTSSTSATHTLTWTAPNEQSLIVTINGVKQHEDAYSVSGTTLTLTSALVAEDKLEVVGINDIGTTITPAQGSVNTDQLANDAVTSAKIADGTIATADIADDAVTADKLANSINTEIAANTAKTGITSGQASAITANTAKVTNATHTGDVTGATALTIATDAVDIAMLSATGTADATTFLRGDNSWASATSSPRFFYAWNTIGGALSASTDTLAPLNGIDQSHSAYDASTYTFTATADDAGKWLFNAQASYYTSTNNGNDYRVYIFKNGSKVSGSYSWSWQTTNYLRHFTVTQQYIVSIANTDTIQMYGYNAVAGAWYGGDGGGGAGQCSLIGQKL